MLELLSLFFPMLIHLIQEFQVLKKSIFASSAKERSNEEASDPRVPPSQRAQQQQQQQPRSVINIVGVGSDRTQGDLGSGAQQRGGFMIIGPRTGYRGRGRNVQSRCCDLAAFFAPFCASLPAIAE